MRGLHFATVLSLLALSLHPITAEATDGFDETASDVLTGVIPFGAYAIAYFKDDDEGRKQWMYTTGTSLVLTSVARLGFNQTSLGERPNGHEYAFPSGHVAFIVSGASFLQERYGWKYGAPAYLMSAYVSAQRVEDGHHHWRDVIAGAALSWAVSAWIVTPYKETQLTPIVNSDMVGISWKRSW